MLKKIYTLCASLNVGFWLLGGVMLFMAIGSFLTGEQSGINDMPLLAWLRGAPLPLSWWLWIVVTLLALLVINTLVCSTDTLVSRFGKGKLVHLFAPQLMHAGFLLVVLAHLLSAAGGSKEGGQVAPGMTVNLPDGGLLRFNEITGQTGPMGMATDYRATVTHTTPRGSQTAVISPNHPYFFAGYGLYLKHAELGPSPFGIVELHREPGSGAALAGGILFTVGNLLLLLIRRGREV